MNFYCLECHEGFKDFHFSKLHGKTMNHVIYNIGSGKVAYSAKGKSQKLFMPGDLTKLIKEES